MRTPRDLPRTAAPILFGLFNIASGITGYNNTRYHVVAYSKAARFMPLDDWALGFVALGLFILFGLHSWQLAWLTSLTAVFWWLLWSSFISQTVGLPGVTPRAIVTTAGLAILHFLLVPYRRKPAPRCDGP